MHTPATNRVRYKIYKKQHEVKTLCCFLCFPILPIIPRRDSNSVAISQQQVPLTGTDAAERVQRVLALFAEPQGRRRMSRGFKGWVTHYSICDKHIELNLPSIALRLSLGLNRLRLSIVHSKYALCARFAQSFSVSQSD